MFGSHTPFGNTRTFANRIGLARPFKELFHDVAGITHRVVGPSASAGVAHPENSLRPSRGSARDRAPKRLRFRHLDRPRGRGGLAAPGIPDFARIVKIAADKFDYPAVGGHARGGGSRSGHRAQFPSLPTKMGTANSATLARSYHHPAPDEKVNLVPILWSITSR